MTPARPSAILNNIKTQTMFISTLLPKESIASIPGVNSKEELLHALVDLLSNELTPDQKTRIRESVLLRESVMSTGVGKGIAIPHGKCSSVDRNFASFIRLDQPIEYQSIDNVPVRYAFLLVGPMGADGEHIKLLSRISRLLNSRSFREKLDATTATDELCAMIQKEERAHFATS